jgi:hypothetical protein
MTIEELLRDRREKAINAGSAACPFCEFGFEVYVIAHDVFKCSICGEHPRSMTPGDPARSKGSECAAVSTGSADDGKAMASGMGIPRP